MLGFTDPPHQSRKTCPFRKECPYHRGGRHLADLGWKRRQTGGVGGEYHTSSEPTEPREQVSGAERSRASGCYGGRERRSAAASPWFMPSSGAEVISPTEDPPNPRRKPHPLTNFPPQLLPPNPRKCELADMDASFLWRS